MLYSHLLGWHLDGFHAAEGVCVRDSEEWRAESSLVDDAGERHGDAPGPRADGGQVSSSDRDSLQHPIPPRRARQRSCKATSTSS